MYAVVQEELASRRTRKRVTGPLLRSQARRQESEVTRDTVTSIREVSSHRPRAFELIADTYTIHMLC